MSLVIAPRLIGGRSEAEASAVRFVCSRLDLHGHTTAQLDEFEAAEVFSDADGVVVTVTRESVAASVRLLDTLDESGWHGELLLVIVAPNSEALAVVQSDISPSLPQRAHAEMLGVLESDIDWHVCDVRVLGDSGIRARTILRSFSQTLPRSESLAG